MKSAVVVGSGVALFAIADVFASFLSWRGAPTDTTWQPSFWNYEVLRLLDWLVLALIAAVLSFAAAYVFSRYPRSFQQHFPAATVIAAVLFCVSAFGAEYATSVRFWRRVPHDDAVALWVSEGLYVHDHLESWLLAVAVILPALLFWQWRRKHQKPTSGLKAEHSCCQ
jgi:hypothetical protein